VNRVDILNWFFHLRSNLGQQTRLRFEELATEADRCLRQHEEQGLERLKEGPGPKIYLGETLSGDRVEVAADFFTRFHSLIAAMNGAGKTMAVALLLFVLLRMAATSRKLGLIILDGKRDLFNITIYALSILLLELERTQPKAAADLRSRTRIIDCDRTDPVTSWGLFALWPGADLEVFGEHRIEFFANQRGSSDTEMTTGVKSLGKHVIMALAEHSLGPDKVGRFLHDATFRSFLLARSKNERVREYFTLQFPHQHKATIGAFERDVDRMCSPSKPLRLMTSAPAAPDVRAAMDRGEIIIATTAGQASPWVQQAYSNFLFSECVGAGFRRDGPETQVLVVVDEAQTFLETPSQRANAMRALTRLRSYKVSLMLMIQNLAIVRDPALQDIINSEVATKLILRGSPENANGMEKFFGVTGRRLRPQLDPFAESEFYSLSEEQRLLREEIASLPDRAAWLWVKGRTEQAVKMKIADLNIPQGRALHDAVQPILEDAGLGMRIGGAEYERLVQERERKFTQLMATGDTGLKSELARQYKRAKSQEE
jgi:hypothetical protein